MNTPLLKYLEYYIGLATPPKYAVMINGGWGSGKTWFIDNLDKHIPIDELNLFKISLYGKSNTSQIDDDIYKAMNPLLSSKGVIVAGALAKAFLRGSLRLDLDGDRRSETNLSFGIPDIKLKELSEKPQKTLIIFDDLERCNIIPSDIFGYINNLTEVHGCKVITLCNERKFNEDEKKEKLIYLNAKEKVIGATFKYKANIDDAVEQFVGEIENNKLKKHINKILPSFKEYIHASKNDNLRFLKRFFMDFERLFSSLKDEHKAIDELIHKLIVVNFILKTESTSNNLSLRELHDAKTEDGQASLAYEISKKYNYYPFSNSVLSLETWNSICQDNSINKNTIDIEIQNSLLNTSEKKESWVRMWDYSTLNEEEFDQSMFDIEKKLKEHHYENENILKHLLGIFIELHEKKIINGKYSKLKKLCHEGIKNLSENNKLEELDFAYNTAFRNESWSGLGFHSKGSDEFNEFIKFIEEKRIEQDNALYPKIEEEIIKLINDKDETYRSMLTPNNLGIKSYYNKPILSSANAKKFCETIIKSDELRLFCMTLNSRYTRNGVATLLTSELNFLTELINELKATLSKSQHPLTKIKINDAIDYSLTPSINELKSCE